MLSTLIILAAKRKSIKTVKDILKNNSVIEIYDKKPIKRSQNSIKPLNNYKYKFNEKKEKMNENENETKGSVNYKRNSAKLIQNGKTIISLNSPIKKVTSSISGYIAPNISSLNLNI